MSTQPRQHQHLQPHNKKLYDERCSTAKEYEDKLRAWCPNLVRAYPLRFTAISKPNGSMSEWDIALTSMLHEKIVWVNRGLESLSPNDEYGAMHLYCKGISTLLAHKHVKSSPIQAKIKQSFPSVAFSNDDADQHGGISMVDFLLMQIASEKCLLLGVGNFKGFSKYLNRNSVAEYVNFHVNLLVNYIESKNPTTSFLSSMKRVTIQQKVTVLVRNLTCMCVDSWYNDKPAN